MLVTERNVFPTTSIPSTSVPFDASEVNTLSPQIPQSKKFEERLEYSNIGTYPTFFSKLPYKNSNLASTGGTSASSNTFPEGSDKSRDGTNKGFRKCVITLDCCPKVGSGDVVL